MTIATSARSTARTRCSALAMEQIPIMRPWYAFPGSNGVRITQTIVDSLARIVEQRATPQAVLTDMSAEVQRLLPRPS